MRPCFALFALVALACSSPDAASGPPDAGACCLDAAPADGAPADAALADGPATDGAAARRLADASDAAVGGSADAVELAVPPSQIGGARPAAVTVPANFAAQAKWPLVLVLHGYGAQGALQDAYLGVSARATAYGFVAVVPEGTQDPAGNQFWNAIPACCDFAKSGVDDLGYLTGLVDEAIAKLRVDPQRVYVVGHSNGGFMAQRLACERADKFVAFASIAGSAQADAGTCKPSAPVAALFIHGTKDATVSYAGSSSGNSSGPLKVAYPGAEELASRWRTLNGCSAQAVVGSPLDHDTQVSGPETLPTAWTGCQGASRVDLWTMTGSAHIPLFTAAFRDRLVEHLLAQVRDN